VKPSISELQIRWHPTGKRTTEEACVGPRGKSDWFDVPHQVPKLKAYLTEYIGKQDARKQTLASYVGVAAPGRKPPDVSAAGFNS
jgi:hypothetical protein